MKFEVKQTRTADYYVTVEIPDDEVPENEEKLVEMLNNAAFDTILKEVGGGEEKVFVDYLTLNRTELLNWVEEELDEV